MHSFRPYRLILLLGVALGGTTTLAVSPMPQRFPAYSVPKMQIYPCDPSVHGNGPSGSIASYPTCYRCTAFGVMQALQIDQSANGRSSQSDGIPFEDIHGGACQNSRMWCKYRPVLGDVAFALIASTAGTPQVQFSAVYDFPNNYCIVFDDNDVCGASLWPSPGNGGADHVTRLQLFDGATKIYDVPAVFEHGIWLPIIDVACDGSAHSFYIKLTNGNSGLCADPATITSSVISVTYPSSGSAFCKQPDLYECPGCEISRGAK